MLSAVVVGFLLRHKRARRVTADLLLGLLAIVDLFCVFGIHSISVGSSFRLCMSLLARKSCFFFAHPTTSRPEKSFVSKRGENLLQQSPGFLATLSGDLRGFLDPKHSLSRFCSSPYKILLFHAVAFGMQEWPYPYPVCAYQGFAAAIYLQLEFFLQVRAQAIHISTFENGTWVTTHVV